MADLAAEVLDHLGLRWGAAGALAAIQYRSEGRFTTDADAVVEWDDRLVPALEAQGYAVRTHTDIDGEHPHLVVAKREGRVDLLVPTVPYQEVALDRAAPGRVLTVEDVLIHKLLAWRPRDRGDIRSILEAGHELDRGYLGHWVAEWELEERWSEAQRDAGLTAPG